MRVTVTGATGLIGTDLVRALQARGDEVSVLTRDPEKARARLGAVEAHRWDLGTEPAPTAALEGRDAVVHLAGENIGQRWSRGVKEEIMESRRLGTRHVVEGLAALGDDARPRALLSASGVDFYAPRGDERLDESGAPGDHFPSLVCQAWEDEAQRAEQLGVRVVRVRTGVVLHPSEGALAKMLPFFKLGIGGPIAGGRQYFPWVSRQDIVGLYVAALDHPTFSGPLNASAPQTVTNKELSRTLGRVLRRPAFAPVPAFAIKALYGEMAILVTSGPRVVPGRADELGYEFGQPELEPALREALGK